MKKYLLALSAILFIASCKTSKDYLSRANEDRTLFDIIKKLNKKGNDEDATKALPTVYRQVYNKHLNKIEMYQTLTDISRWDKLYTEYDALQKIYDAIIASDAALLLVTPQNYSNAINAMKQSAAQDYYLLGDSLLAYGEKEYARKAYKAFKRADGWVSNFRDTRTKMTAAYDAGIINVVINPIQDNSYFNNSGWGNNWYNYSNDYFQQNLVRDLGGTNAKRYPARFYSDWEARRENVQPEWSVDLTLRRLDIPRPSIYSYNRNLSRKVENGRDTSGNIIYQQVYATLNIQRQSFSARGEMSVNITDLLTRKNISYNTYSENYDWQEERADYSGDSRALSSSDWALVNNRNFSTPDKDDILREIYRKIYLQVKNRIGRDVDW